MDKPIRLYFISHSAHKYYVYQNKKSQWSITSQNGMSEAFSNFTDEPVLFRFALEDAKTEEEALAAVDDFVRFASAGVVQ